MNHKIFLLALNALLFAVWLTVEAQQPSRVFRIGFISPASSQTARPNLDALRFGLQQLGYVEGKNIIIDARWAEGSVQRLSVLLTELIQSKMDVIVIGGAAGARAAKSAGSSVPIVFAAVTDPLGNGIVESLARPAGNITGVALALGEGFSGKWVELLNETVPKLRKFAVLRNPDHPVAPVFLRETKAAAQALGKTLDFFDARDQSDLANTLIDIERAGSAALVLTPDPLFSARRSLIVDFVTKLRLPCMFFSREFVDVGGLMSYGPSFPDSYRRAAIYIDKILKGAKPADLPIEQPKKFELVINLKTAKQIGLTVPPNVLARADKVIK